MAIKFVLAAVNTHIGGTTMSVTMTPSANGRSRRSLNESIVRLDEMIDGLSEAIPATIRDTLKESIAEAITEGVKAAVVEVLTNPALQAKVGEPIRTKSPPLRDLVRQLVSRARQVTARGSELVGQTVSAARQSVTKRIKLVGSLVGRAKALRIPALIAVGAGMAAVAVAAIAPNWVGTVLSGVGGMVTAASVQGWLWVRRAIRPILAG